MNFIKRLFRKREPAMPVPVAGVTSSRRRRYPYRRVVIVRSLETGEQIPRLARDYADPIFKTRGVRVQIPRRMVAGNARGFIIELYKVPPRTSFERVLQMSQEGPDIGVGYQAPAETHRLPPLSTPPKPGETVHLWFKVEEES